MSKELKTKVTLELEKEMIFKCDPNEMKIKDCYIDETNEDLDMLGPNPVKLLASAVLGCLSASLIFCIQKKKLALKDFKSEAEIIIARNEEGLFRVKEINVELQPKTDDPEIIRRIDQCKKIFERYCTITESVRAGIPVNLNIDIKK